MSPEARRQRERLARAFAWVQRRLGTHFDIVLHADRAEDTMGIERSDRGLDDPLCFVLTYNVEAIATKTVRDLRSDALHELLHAMWWPFYEAGCEGRSAAAKRALLRIFEVCTYETERRLGPWVLGR